MDSSELAFFTSEQLVSELLRRKTFLGVIVQAEQELRNGSWPQEQMFRVQFNRNLRMDEAGRLLNVVANFIDRDDTDDALE